MLTNNIPAPHLVPLSPKNNNGGEKTLKQIPSLFNIRGAGQANLASPMGRGARQRGEGMGFRNLARIFDFDKIVLKEFSRGQHGRN